MLGEAVTVVGHDAHDVIIHRSGGTSRLHAPDGRFRELQPIAPTPAPFRATRRTAWTRLEWNGGACDVGDNVAFWGKRYAATALDGVGVIDATGAGHAHLEVALRGQSGMVAHRGQLWIGLDTGVLAIPLRALEELQPGPVEVVARVSYPLRQPDVREPAVVAWLYGRNDAIVNVRQRRVWLDAELYGLAKGTRFTLCDELWPGEFATIEVPGKPPRELRAIEVERTLAGRVTLGIPPHPLRAGIQPDAFRIDRVVPLLVQLADDPDDAETRSVLIDLLQDEGAPYAQQLAELRGGGGWAPPLGPLAHLFCNIQVRDRLPWFATVVQHPPDDDELFALIGRDARMGMLREIRRGNAPALVYARILALPMALGVRVVDSCGRDVLNALRRAGRDRVTHLRDFNIGKATSQELLAQPTFDRVRELQQRVPAQNLDNVLDAIADDRYGCFARVARRITLDPEGSPVLAFAPVLRRWPELPIAAIRACGITLERNGDATVASIHPDASADTRVTLLRTMPDAKVQP